MSGNPSTPTWKLVEGPAAAGWAPLADLHDPAQLRPLVERIRISLGGCEPRAAASALSLGLSARLWTITLVWAASHGVIPDPATLQWSDRAGSVTLGAEHPSTLPADQLGPAVLASLGALNDALRNDFRLPEQLLWGNVAAALAGVKRLESEPTVAILGDALLADPPLAGHIHQGRRTTTCCLFYRVAGGGLCGDCLFTTAPGRRDVGSRNPRSFPDHT